MKFSHKAPASHFSTRVSLVVCLLASMVGIPLLAQNQEINITKTGVIGGTKPILVCATGFSGEALQTLDFDLYVQGFALTNAEAAQFLISGTQNDNLAAKATDKFNKSVLVSKSYQGAPLRRQVHAFTDDFIKALNGKGIAQTSIAYKSENGKVGEIFIADFDGNAAQAVTSDNALVASPDWVTGKRALYYVSYKRGHPEIFFHDLPSGSRKVFAPYGGSNMSPSASPDGSQVAMILSKDGWTDLYVGPSSGSGVKRLTKSREDESAPCWSPDGKWICFAGKIRERRSLCKIPAGGGEIQRIRTDGAPNPTEPDWSPDNKWIVFTSMAGGGFEICVVAAEGGTATSLGSGEDPVWAPNSRTVAFVRRQGNRRWLSLLDVMTKQSKDISRISGNNSQPSWAR